MFSSIYDSPFSRFVAASFLQFSFHTYRQCNIKLVVLLQLYRAPYAWMWMLGVGSFTMHDKWIAVSDKKCSKEKKLGHTLVTHIIWTVQCAQHHRKYDERIGRMMRKGHLRCVYGGTCQQTIAHIEGKIHNNKQFLTMLNNAAWMWVGMAKRQKKDI